MNPKPFRIPFCWTTILGVCLAMASLARSSVYHVAAGHPEASDENPGTEAAPFKTINGALPHLGPGDEVIVHEGIYREQIVLPARDWHWERHTYPAFPSGRSYSEMIAFTARPGDTVVLKGSEVVEGWQRHEGDLWYKDGWTRNSQQMFCDGVVLRQVGGTMGAYLTQGTRWPGRFGDGIEDLEPFTTIEHPNPHGGEWVYRIEAAGSFYLDREAQRLYVRLSGDRDPNAHLMEVSVLPFHFNIGASYIRVSGFTMKHAGTSAIVNWSAIQLGGSHILFENVSQSWSDFSGISIGGRNNTIINCSFNHNGNKGMGGSGRGHRVIDSETSWNNYRNWSHNWHAGGMKVIPYAHDWVVSGHRALHNNGHGIWFDAWMSNVTVEQSLSAYNRGNGIFYEIGERGVIKNNRFHDNAERGIYVPDSSDTLVAHNTTYRNGMSGIVVIGTGRRGGAYGHAGDGVLYTRNNVVWGNLLMDNNWPALAPKDWGNRAELILPDDRASNLNNRSDYNLFFRSGGRSLPFFRGWGAATYDTLEAWREATGNDQHSLLADPGFIDLEQRDFRPATGSPAIGLVPAHMSIRFDADGAARTGNRLRTAGAFEAPADEGGN